MTPDEIIKGMTKGLIKVDADLDEMKRENVIYCTETGKHLIYRDENGECSECGYSESIDDILKK
jgi:hypothetical protein